MHPQHRVLLASLQKNQRRRIHSQANDSYLSSGHHYYDVSIPVCRMLAKDWLRENRGIATAEFVATLESLYRGKSYEEKILASILLASHGDGRATVGFKRLDGWLDLLVGWAEIDSVCQSSFTAEELLANWREWERFIRALARDRNINKRRAALVLLTSPVRKSADKRLAALAFEIVELLKSEREIIITKAISWLLRSMVPHHRQPVTAYIKASQSSLPAIAVRETQRKIDTGRK